MRSNESFPRAGCGNSEECRDSYRARTTRSCPTCVMDWLRITPIELSEFPPSSLIVRAKAVRPVGSWALGIVAQIFHVSVVATRNLLGVPEQWRCGGRPVSDRKILGVVLGVTQIFRTQIPPCYQWLAGVLGFRPWPPSNQQSDQRPPLRPELPHERFRRWAQPKRNRPPPSA